MAESAPPNKAGNGAADATASGPFYEKQRQRLKELIARKRTLEKRIALQEDSIYKKETEYLENTPGGNIITGFDNYTKGAGNAASARRKTGLTDANRVFSRSSTSYNSNADAQTPVSTPASHAPTPLSTSFSNKDKDGAASGGMPTPTSATAATSKNAAKKGKRANAATAAAAAAAAASTGGAGGGGEDSETDSRETKKVRTNFGAVRK
ncbi:chromatin modification-related protein eaf-6 [Lasiosphaeria ovina]|uniref:Chromatin modification-related protein EAF6 n=1 Tax=Lasiosphaeria ovina TaxID=92902 RepID=A0AAE0NIU6_9PEZI|nr:chromatin modification-related protein eaf-6 [Lasiosphaeria ovina]